MQNDHYFVFSRHPVENEEHCEFIYLRNFLTRTHLQDLIETTAQIHYEAFRAKQLLAIKESTQSTASTSASSQVSPSTTPNVDTLPNSPAAPVSPAMGSPAQSNKWVSNIYLPGQNTQSTIAPCLHSDKSFKLQSVSQSVSSKTIMCSEKPC